jgi:hypothetical protein
MMPTAMMAMMDGLSLLFLVAGLLCAPADDVVVVSSVTVAPGMVSR